MINEFLDPCHFRIVLRRRLNEVFNIQGIFFPADNPAVDQAGVVAQQRAFQQGEQTGFIGETQQLAPLAELARRRIAAAGHGELAFAARRRLGRSLRDRQYGRAIVLPRSFKSALVPWFAGIPRRTGFSSEMRVLLLNDLRKLDRRRLDQTVKRFAALAVRQKMTGNP